MQKRLLPRLLPVLLVLPGPAVPAACHFQGLIPLRLVNGTEREAGTAAEESGTERVWDA